MQLVELLNIQVHNLSMEETLHKVDDAIVQKHHLHHAVVNAGKIVAMQKDIVLKKSVNAADIINADGQAVIWASKLLNKPLKERVAGIDLMANLVELAAKRSYTIYLLGAKQEVVSRLKDVYTRKYGENLVAGYRNGYFTKEEEASIVEEIVQSGAKMLFVAISSPTKENFLAEHQEALRSINFVMGVGGSFDVFAGEVKRAPIWVQNIGMEWFYRFLQEPKRMWKRYLIGNSKFIYLVLKESLQKKSPSQS